MKGAPLPLAPCTPTPKRVQGATTWMPRAPNPKAKRRQRGAFGLSRALARKLSFGAVETFRAVRICTRHPKESSAKPKAIVEKPHALGPLVGGGVACARNVRT